MSLETLVVWVVVGALAGWLASIVMRTNRSQGLITDIIVGVVGGLLGGVLLTSIGIRGLVTGINLGSIAVAFVGAVFLLFVLRLFGAGPRRTRVR
ncbi:MAG: GlsB/YeaQ/YmgE family stress response membrane protein [Chloroflexota bacterium]